MGVEHAPEKVWQAQDLYCLERLSFKRISTVLGVADSTLRRWAKQFGWQEERASMAKALLDIRANTVKARAKTVERLVNADNDKNAAQLAFAVAGLERLAWQVDEAKEKRSQPGPAPAQAPERAKTPQTDAPQEDFSTLAGSDEERIALLEQSLNRQLAFVLTNPVEDISKRVRDIKGAFDLLAKLKGGDSKDSQIVISFEE